MRPQDLKDYHQIEEELLRFDLDVRSMPGIQDRSQRDALIQQILESKRRVKYVAVMGSRDVSEIRADPNDQLFDPLKAAELYKRCGNNDEAFWLVFLFVHFGKHPRAGWRYAREVYGRLGEIARWDWATVSAEPSGFREWLDVNQGQLRSEGIPGGFGNHRKYQSLDGYSPNGTGAAVASYVEWVAPPRTHLELIEQVGQLGSGTPREAFEKLYRSMRVVASFGRTARFDYLTMIGKIGLAPIEPGSAHMEGSTGPINGARLLLGDSPKAMSQGDIDDILVELEGYLDVGTFGMQVLEDALCNWQKNPESFKPFRG